MVYATLADLVQRYGDVEMRRLSVVDGEVPAQPAAPRIEAAIEEASRLVDSYLRARYVTPLAAPVPAEIRGCVCILARYRLAHGGDREPSEQMRLDHDAQLKWLAALARGDAVLAGAVPIGAGGGAGAAMASDRPRPFDTSTFGGW